METRKSTDITTDIQKAEARLAQVKLELAALANEREKTLRSPTFDDTKLAELESREQTLTREAAHLEKRIALLTADREEAETSEAQRRLDALPAEAEALRVECVSLLGCLDTDLVPVLKRIKVIAEIHRKHAWLSQENAWLVERFEGTHRSPLPQLPEVPNFINIADEMAKAFYAILEQRNPWQEKRLAWTNAGRQRPLRRIA